MMKKDYSTMVEALQDLKSQGYSREFEISGDQLKCTSSGVELKPTDCKVDGTYRFEGESNPSDMSIVYAISAPKKDLKGTLVSAYGVYSEPLKDELVKLLQMDRDREK